MMDPSQKLKKIVKKVLWAHLFLLLFLMINFKGFKKKPSNKKVALKENFRVIEKPKPPKKITQTLAKAKPTLPQKKVSQSKANSPKKVASKAKPTPFKKPEVKMASNAEKKELMKFEKVKEQPPSDAKTMPLEIPKSLAKLSVEEEIHKEVDKEVYLPNGQYVEYLKSNIVENIDIEPHCFVLVELTLNQEGKILNIKHKKSSDSLSKDYIIESLSKMEFSHFFGEVVNESEYTFVLTLKDPFS